jgi:AbiU2
VGIGGARPGAYDRTTKAGSTAHPSAFLMLMDIGDAVEFQRLFDALVRELVDANIVFKLHTDLDRSTARFGTAMDESWTFWFLTRQSTLDAAAYRLCKVYDQSSDAVNLRNLLETIQARPERFLPEEYAKRVHAKLAEDPPNLDAAQLAKDIAFATAASNPLVKNLLTLRNNFFAHLGASLIKSGESVANKYPLTKESIGELLGTGMEIANRYSIAFRAHSYMTRMAGQNDFVQVLEAVNERALKIESDRDEQLRRLGVDPSQLA